MDAAAARCRNHTPHEQHAVLAERQTNLREEVIDRPGTVNLQPGTFNLERRLDAGLLRAVPHGRGVGARAQHEFKRAHEHALARAGFAGDDVQARVELDVGRFDDGQVAD